MKNFIQKYYHWICIIFIAIISFFFYSYLRYPLLNSDDAWVVLMAHSFHLPEDLFYWNQSRGGNIVPLIAQIFIKLFNFRAITAVSISEYLLLFIGVTCFSSLFRNKVFKIMLATIFFLPFQRFIDITRFFIGWEYCVLSIAIFLINKLWNMDKTTLIAKIMMGGVIFVFIIAIWVLYNAVFSIATLFAVLLMYNSRKIPHKNVVIFTIIGTVVSFFALLYIYSFNNGECAECNKINNIAEVFTALQTLYIHYKEVLLFQTGEWFVALHTYVCIIFFISLIYFIVKQRYYKLLIKDKWIVFFLADFCAFFGIHLLSHWVLLNDMGRWYYVSCYISMSMCVLLIFDRLFDEKQIRTLRYTLYFTLFMGALTPIITMKFNNPKTLRPMESYARELESLGHIGIIAEWWNAYICSISNPDKVVSTPHDNDFSYTRNPKRAYEVVQMDTIYLIKDMWLNEFPNEITQFGVVLIKDGDEFHKGDWQMCRYRKKF